MHRYPLWQVFVHDHRGRGRSGWMRNVVIAGPAAEFRAFAAREDALSARLEQLGRAEAVLSAQSLTVVIGSLIRRA